jgi:hypothetical protein
VIYGVLQPLQGALLYVVRTFTRYLGGCVPSTKKRSAGVPDDIPHRGYQLIQKIHFPGTRGEFDTDVTKSGTSGNGVPMLTSGVPIA